MGKVNARSTYSKSRILNWSHPHQGNVTAGATLGCIGARKIQCVRCSSRPIRPPRPSPRRLQHTLSGPGAYVSARVLTNREIGPCSTRKEALAQFTPRGAPQRRLADSSQTRSPIKAN
jgi:hypothetical protein